MKKVERISRRELAKRIGVAAGVGVVGAQTALADIVTPSQTAGPFYPADKGADVDLDLTQIRGHAQSAFGEQILVHGRIVDESGNPLRGALVDIWQANHHGRYAHAQDPNTAPLDDHFQGQGIVTTGEDGRYRFKTIRPGAYPLGPLGGVGWRCQHIHFKVTQPQSAALTTQMYFEGDPLIEDDLEIAKVPTEHRDFLIAKAVTDRETGLLIYRFDVVMPAA